MPIKRQPYQLRNKDVRNKTNNVKKSTNIVRSPKEPTYDVHRFICVKAQ